MKRAFGVTILVLVLVTAVAAGCRTVTGLEELGLVWSDEFDGPAGESPDSTSWRFDIGTNWGNAQLEYDTDRPVNVATDGEGHLAIVAREESYLGCDYTSGRINTRDLFEHERGRFEARIKLPVGQGVWPAFWLLGSNFEAVGWPTCGEIDIMEYRGQEPSVVHGSLHGPGYSGGSALTESYVLSGEGFNEDFHVFAIDWDRDSIEWLVDGQVYNRIARYDLPVGTDWVFNQPFFIILNVAIGGYFIGPPDETTEFPQTMLVDWVRVYGTGS